MTFIVWVFRADAVGATRATSELMVNQAYGAAFFGDLALDKKQDQKQKNEPENNKKCQLHEERQKLITQGASLAHLVFQV
jgi:hypothetical protein